MPAKALNANELKGIAMAAMTLDHLVSVLWPGYPTHWWILLLHLVGRVAAPIFWFFIAEGYHYTHDRKRYALRLLVFAVAGHFAYNFAFGIPFVPFTTSVFNQTSVIWALLGGLAALSVRDCERLKGWHKALLTALIAALTFCADWSCIAVFAILAIDDARGNFKKQMTGMMFWVCIYAAVYALFIHPLYGLLQLGVALAIPLLRRYNGAPGRWRGGKWFFYAYYPLHLVLCGLIRIALHGNIGVMIGG